MAKTLDPSVKKLLHEGTVIPAHPLALQHDHTIDVQRQQALTRYYIASGAGGVAVGVHTTQFEIRKPGIDLLEPVLRLTAETIDSQALSRPFIRVAGVCGPLGQALKEAALAAKYGYHLALVSLGGLGDCTEEELAEHIRAIAEVIPVFGFYLQPAVGGRRLSYAFWSAIARMENVCAIKVAAFNRYQTLDVVNAVCHSGRADEIALYTGNDDNIVADLLTPYRIPVDGRLVEKRFVGGLLGHWAVWTKQAVSLFAEIRDCIANNYAGADRLLAKGIAVTDMNAAIFDAVNSFRGSIAGIHEVLRRQGLLQDIVCIDPKEKLSSGQSGQIDRIYQAWKSYTDDAFVQEFLRREQSARPV